MLTLDQLTRLVGDGEIDTVLVVFTDLYGRFMGKRMDADFFLEQVADHGMHACNYLLTVDMEMEPVPGYELANWEKGYGDFCFAPDLATLRSASWLDRTAMILCDAQHDDGKAVDEAPRTLLRRQVEAAAAQGFDVMAGSEIEYYIFRDSYREAAERAHHDLNPAGWYIDDYHALQGARVEDLNAAARRHLKSSGVPVESTKGEWGLGQHELNIRYADVLEMADRHCIQKQCLKELADRLGISVTFMAKFAAQGAGSSCHLHLSLWNGDRNAFAADGQTFRHFLGGWLSHVPEMMVFYAPTINAYKRFRSGTWAPTRLGWSHDNRTAGFRIVGHGESLRIECRVPGADCNAYLAYTAALASGLDGMANKIDPPPPHEGDVYHADDLPRVPMSLREATDLFAASDFTKRVLGESVVEHYAHFFRTEQSAFDDTVTDWERRRYFERI